MPRTISLGQRQLEMIGKKFGRLLILGYAEKVSELTRHTYYFTRCECGGEKTVAGTSLRNGSVRSCGCLHLEQVKDLGNRTGEKNSQYLFGFTKEIREFRKAINARDKVCQHKGEHKGCLEVHHLDGDHYNNDLSNGILLCKRHHAIVTGKSRGRTCR